MAMTNAQLQELITALPTPPGQKVSKFSSLDGAEWRVWRRNFEIVAVINGWNNLRQRQQARVAMEGDASEAVSDIDHAAANLTCAQLLDLYQARFLPATETALARVRFKRAASTSSETPLEWSTRVRALFKAAYPDGNAQTNQDLIDQFNIGLRDRVVCTHVVSLNPVTLAEALAAAQSRTAAEEFVLAGRTALQDDAGANTTNINAVHNSNQDDGDSSNQMKCWFCNNTAHLRRECRLYQKAMDMIKDEKKKSKDGQSTSYKNDTRERKRGNGRFRGGGRGGKRRINHLGEGEGEELEEENTFAQYEDAENE